MGRWSTGAITTDGAIKLELSYLLKNGYIKKGYNTSASLSWTDGSSIHYILHNDFIIYCPKFGTAQS
jgi:hypothetical protein